MFGPVSASHLFTRRPAPVVSDLAVPFSDRSPLQEKTRSKTPPKLPPNGRAARFFLARGKSIPDLESVRMMRDHSLKINSRSRKSPPTTMTTKGNSEELSPAYNDASIPELASAMDQDELQLVIHR